MMDPEVADSLSPDFDELDIVSDHAKKSEINNVTCAKKSEINHVTRAIEISRFTGASAQGFYYKSVEMSNKNISSDQVTANIHIGNIIGNGAGLIFGLLLHFLARKSYRTGSHQLLWVETKPDASHFKLITADAAYIRYDDNLYYYNRITRSLSPEPICSIKDFTPYFDGMEKGNSRLLSTEKKEKLAIQIPAHKSCSGSHQFLWVETKPDASHFKLITADAAYIRYEDNLYYYNRASSKPLILICSKKPSDYFKDMKVGGERHLLPQEVNELAYAVDHIPCTGRTSTNPLYRNYKVLASFGWQVGAVVSNFIGIEDHNKKRLISAIMSDIGCIFFGLIAIPYWLIREKFFKIQAGSKHKYGLTGTEGWSKYTKTCLVIGTSIGQTVGGIVASIHHTSVSAASFTINLWGGIVGAASFVFGLVFIPFTNWVSSKFTNQEGIFIFEDKNKFRNNYTRSGITLGAGIGASIGLLVGHLFFEPILAGIIFSAVGSVVFGILLSIYGHKIHNKLHPEHAGKDPENSWDYATRSTANVFGFIGAAIVCLINPGAALLLTPIGTAIAGLVGWVAGLAIMKIARRVNPNEDLVKADTVPWTQRITTGTNIGALLGGALGIGVGFLGFVFTGPASIILAISFFSAVGAVVGGLFGVLAEDKGRGIITEGIKYLFIGGKNDKNNKDGYQYKQDPIKSVHLSISPYSTTKTMDNLSCNTSSNVSPRASDGDMTQSSLVQKQENSSSQPPAKFMPSFFSKQENYYKNSTNSLPSSLTPRL